MTDVLILGGGPAGLAAAIALRQKGIECLVVEALEPAIDKGCAEGLMPDALPSLRELGLDITEQQGHRFRDIRFNNLAHQVHADFPNGTGVGVRRTKLHGLIADRSAEAGVPVLWSSRAKLLDSCSALVNGEDIFSIFDRSRRPGLGRSTVGAPGRGRARSISFPLLQTATTQGVCSVSQCSKEYESVGAFLRRVSSKGEGCEVAFSANGLGKQQPRVLD